MPNPEEGGSPIALPVSMPLSSDRLEASGSEVDPATRTPSTRAADAAPRALRTIFCRALLRERLLRPSTVSVAASIAGSTAEDSIAHCVHSASAGCSQA